MSLALVCFDRHALIDYLISPDVGIKYNSNYISDPWTKILASGKFIKEFPNLGYWIDNSCLHTSAQKSTFETFLIL